ncbi:MAG: inorganic phosphate transporter, partial [Acidobacteria bacterium]|nr:inorganic phosphate transporter [Acidobacteriota bacterium]
MLITFLLTIALAAANGANDVSKGVATLAGSGVTRYRTAILWGAATSLAGALVSGLFAERLIRLFSSSIVTAKPTRAFTVSVICGTVGWVTLATLTGLPVSTTHAIIGSMLGAGLLFAPGGIAWSSLAPRLAMPLLLSIGVSYAVSAGFNRMSAARGAESADCLCVGAEQLDTGVLQMTHINVVTGTTQECASA